MPDSLGLPRFPAAAAIATATAPLSDAQPLSASPAVVNRAARLGHVHQHVHPRQ